MSSPKPLLTLLGLFALTGAVPAYADTLIPKRFQLKCRSRPRSPHARGCPPGMQAASRVKPRRMAPISGRRSVSPLRGELQGPSRHGACHRRHDRSGEAEGFDRRQQR